MKFVFEVDTIEQAQAVIAAISGAPAPAKGGKGKKADEAPATTTSPAPAPTTPVVVAPVPPDSQATASASGKTIEDVKKVVVDAASKLTVPVVVEILKATAGVQKAGQVPADKFDAVIAAITAKVAATEAESLV